MSIALCLIMKNESKNIPNLMNSVKGIFDQVIAIDTGSEDDSIALMKDLGAEVYECKIQDDFSAWRNYALQYVKTEFWGWL